MKFENTKTKHITSNKYQERRLERILKWILLQLQELENPPKNNCNVVRTITLDNKITGSSSQRWWPRLPLIGLRHQEYWLLFKPSKMPSKVISRVSDSTHPTCNKITNARASCWRFSCHRCSTWGCFDGREGPTSSCIRSCNGVVLDGKRVRIDIWERKKFRSSSGWSSLTWLSERTLQFDMFK
jgi:hypothetical protein